MELPRKKQNFRLKESNELFRLVTMAMSFDDEGQSMVVFKSVSTGVIFTIPLTEWNEYFELIS